VIVCSTCKSTECPCVEADNYPEILDDLEQDKADFWLEELESLKYYDADN
jgi:hypothetical protein